MVCAIDHFINSIDESWRRGEISATMAHHSKTAFLHPFWYAFVFCIPAGIELRKPRLIAVGFKILYRMVLLRIKIHALYVRALVHATATCGPAYVARHAESVKNALRKGRRT